MTAMGQVRFTSAFAEFATHETITRFRFDWSRGGVDKTKTRAFDRSCVRARPAWRSAVGFTDDSSWAEMEPAVLPLRRRKIAVLVIPNGQEVQTSEHVSRRGRLRSEELAVID